MPAPIPLLIADSKEIVRAGLRAMLAGTAVNVVGEASNVPSTLTLAKQHKPAVILLDPGLFRGNAFELAVELQKTPPAPKFIFLSAINNPTHMARAKIAGASNFLLMHFIQRELVTAIENAVAGKPVSGTEPFARILLAMEPRDLPVAREAGLTPRETQVLSHVALCLSNNEIARSLGISPHTVKQHIKNLLSKLAVNDRMELAVWALRSGIV